MKKLFLLPLFLLTCIIFNAEAQTLVDTKVHNKTVVLEEFTGIRCGYCPVGHQIAEGIYDNNPDRVILINIHQGNYASPYAGQPDYRTPFGNALAGQAGVNGWPSGTVNRELFSGQSHTSLSRGLWAMASDLILDQVAPVNVGASSSYDEASRKLTIKVELYYTDDSPASTNYVNVALLQNGIMGPQSGASTNPYEHKHMLRHLITGQWGEEITTTTTGTFVEKTYEYIVPEDYNSVPCNVEDCEIAVFVTESHQKIYNGCKVSAIGGTTLIPSSISTPEEVLTYAQANTTATFNLNVKNMLPENEDFELTLQKIGEPDDWNSSFTINSNSHEQSVETNLVANEVTDFTINVTPGNTSSITKYVFTAKSLSNPNLDETSVEFYVMNEIKTLLIHNKGNFSDNSGAPVDFEPAFFTAFNEAGVTQYASCRLDVVRLLVNANRLQDIENLYFNVAWTNPTFTDESVGFFKEYLDNGGHLFISGQDIGWDIWYPSGTSGTVLAKNFYTNYLKAEWIDDGMPTNSSVYAQSEDDFFGSITNFDLTNVYSNDNSMYPDEINATSTGVPILFYNNNPSKNCAVRSNSDIFKTVYLGFDFAMATPQGQKDIIKATKEFFESPLATNDIQSKPNISIYPNPCYNELNISIRNDFISTVEIYNYIGKKVFQKNYEKTSDIKINTSNLKAGIYLLKVNNETQTIVIF